MTPTEIDNMENISRVEAVLTNFAFTFLGALLGSIISLVTENNGPSVWVIFWASLILTVVLGVLAWYLSMSRKKIKDQITGSNLGS